MSDCDKILQSGISDITKIEYGKALVTSVSEALEGSFEQYREKRLAQGGQSGGSYLEIFSGHLDLSQDKSEFEKLQNEYTSDKKRFLSENVQGRYFKSQTNESIVSAWLKCIGITNEEKKEEPKQLIAYCKGDETTTFTVVIQYTPDEASDPDLTVNSVVLNNVKRNSGANNIKGNAKLKKFNSLVQLYDRVNPRKEASITVGFKEMSAVSIDLKPVTSGVGGFGHTTTIVKVYTGKENGSDSIHAGPVAKEYQIVFPNLPPDARISASWYTLYNGDSIGRNLQGFTTIGVSNGDNRRASLFIAGVEGATFELQLQIHCLFQVV